MARALLSEADISSSPVVAGMRLGGRSPDARTGCGIDIRHDVEELKGKERTAFSEVGTMVDLKQRLYQTTCHGVVEMQSEHKTVYRSVVGPLCVVVVVGVKMAVARARAVSPA